MRAGVHMGTGKDMEAMEQDRAGARPKGRPGGGGGGGDSSWQRGEVGSRKGEDCAGSGRQT